MKRIILFYFVAVLAISCSKDDASSSSSSSGSGSGGNANTTVPAVYNKIYGVTSITSDGTYLTVKTKGLPDHKSCYYATTDALFEAKANGTLTFNGEVFARAPNNIAEKAYVFKIPLIPALNTAHASTPMGAIGFALNGVPLYNQYAAGGNTLAGEMKGFDQYYGHPQMQGGYHYHVEPLYITTVKAMRSSLVGFLLDGFPVYGPEENGSLVAETALDPYHGHTGATADYPSGIYHYHVTAVSPYINGSGFYGTPGTVSQ